jgi:uncharacterized protein DUF953
VCHLSWNSRRTNRIYSRTLLSSRRDLKPRTSKFKTIGVVTGNISILDDASSEQLYSKFDKALGTQDGSPWVLAIFEGSPQGPKYSWCSDCIAASGQVRDFLDGYRGMVKVVQFKVGSKLEWEGAGGDLNPFKAKFPHLSDLPTAILFYGRQDVARTIAPKKDDLLYLSHRADELESQIKDGSWLPPRALESRNLT